MVAGMAEAGQSCDEPLHGQEEGRPHQDVLAETIAYGDQPLTDGTWTMMDRTPPVIVGRLLGHVEAMLG